MASQTIGSGTTRLAPQGRVVMLSGANRGIGRAVAERLAEDGYSLSVGVRDPASFAEIAGLAERLLVSAFDARKPGDAARWVQATVERFGRLDALINNAGILLEIDFETGDESALDDMFEVNAKAPFRLIKHALPHLKACGHGRILNVVSLSGVRFRGGSVGYAMSKYAATALTSAARQAAWDDGVRATAICPGPVATDMVRGRFAISDAEMTQPETVADVIAMVLALPNSASVAFVPINAWAETTI